ncbi:MAG: hypothetical protein OEZ10_01070 [Gammaproteobacteria bacterium]|nr:hypothetical protein [Gammaproteobacteria bacterium]
MRLVPDSPALSKPSPGKAKIIFVRPHGTTIQGSIFKIEDNQPSIIAILAGQKKFDYEVDPGKHLFMIVGEAADFMSANVVANKTYYVYVYMRAGVLRQRLSMEAIPPAKLDSFITRSYLRASQWVDTTPATDRWAQGHMPSIMNKYMNYYAKWTNKDM